jgi:hypothetical protein
MLPRPSGAAMRFKASRMSSAEMLVMVFPLLRLHIERPRSPYKLSQFLRRRRS